MAASDSGWGGSIGRTVAESTPAWPNPTRPPDGSPNVVFILLDDTGFADFGCYGSEIDTPNFDRLAAGGLRYNSFHTTSLCSPTRACLVTGRNHHSVGMRGLSDADGGFPNARGHISDNAATIAEMLREAGYSTLATGKWHLAPMDTTSSVGPFDQWPLGRGFERYYGFLAGATDHFYPELTYDNHHIEPPRTFEQGYHLTEDIADMSIRFVADQQSALPEKPFFLYMSLGATHSPHQAPKEYIEKYRGRFDSGWDILREECFARQKELGIIPQDCDLPPRNGDVRPWDSLGESEKKVFLRYYEAYAAMLDHADHHVGRFIDFLEEMGQLDNTLIFLMSDNGATNIGRPNGTFHQPRQGMFGADDIEEVLSRIDEIGTPMSSNLYPAGWGQLGNTPLRRYKSYTDSGGVRDPLIVHWPAQIKEGGQVRQQFHHVIDIVPTVLEILGLEAPSEYRGVSQKPIEGTSMAYTFHSPGADEPTRKETQYFEMWGCLAIWHKGWKAIDYHWEGDDYNNDRWELYNLDEDFSECHDLAGKYPEKLKEMIEQFWIEAGKYDVLPLDDRMSAILDRSHKPGTPVSRKRFEYFPPVSRVSSYACPTLGARSWTLSADVERPDSAADGVLVGISGFTRSYGMSLYIKDGHVVFDYNIFGDHHQVVSESEVPVGRSIVEVHIERTAEGAEATVIIDDDPAGKVPIPRIISFGGGMTIGRDGLSPVPRDDYQAPFPFSGRIRRVVFNILDKPVPASPRRGPTVSWRQIAR
jgi:arylsulfatase A-like enzyme